MEVLILRLRLRANFGTRLVLVMTIYSAFKLNQTESWWLPVRVLIPRKTLKWLKKTRMEVLILRLKLLARLGRVWEWQTLLTLLSFKQTETFCCPAIRVSLSGLVGI